MMVMQGQPPHPANPEYDMKSLSTIQPGRILVCQQRQIGDVIISTLCVELLKKRFPDAEIHFLTEKKCAPVLENNPHIAKVWTIDRSLSFLQNIAFYWKVADNKFDLVVDFQQLPRLRYITGLSRAKYRLTCTPPWYNRIFYTHWTDQGKGYAGHAKAAILKPLGIEVSTENRPHLYLTKAEKADARDFLARLGINASHTLVTVDATHKHKTRKWPARHYGKLIRLAATERPDLRFLLLWGPGEEKDARQVLDHANMPENCILPEKMLSLREMAAVIEAADVQLGNCSSPRHFAVAVDTPTLTLIGSTGNTAWSFPSDRHQWVDGGLEQGLACRQCNKNQCPEQHIQCLNGLEAPTVLKRFLPMLPEK